MISNQQDIKVLTIKDYIMNPKTSGYRSYHMILAVPVYLSDRMANVKVEVQIRTVAMDFWASLEHEMKYKKDIENAEVITEDLKFSADLINLFAIPEFDDYSGDFDVGNYVWVTLRDDGGITHSSVNEIKRLLY